MKTARSPRRLAIATPALLALGLGAQLLFVELAGGPAADAPSPGAVQIRLLGVNDFHGHLEAAGSLGAHLDRAAAERPGQTIRVHAGDMVGASPLISSWFHDEPSVEAMNLMGFDIGTVGNHEFDEGTLELMRLLRGGRRQGPDALKRDADGRVVNTSDPHFRGVNFPYTAANSVDRNGRLLLPPWRIVERAGVRVGFIGVTTTTTPTYLLARHSAGVRFLDASESVNHYVPELTRRGVRAIVVLAHSGAHTSGDPGKPSGEIVEEARQMSSEVDVVIAGHTHNEINARIPNADGGGDKVIVEARSYGTAFDQVDLEIDRDSGEVTSKVARVPTTERSDVTLRTELVDLVRRLQLRIAPLAQRQIGRTRAPLSRARLGQIAAEAQRRFAGADIGVVNSGNLRDDLPAGPITFEHLFSVHAYEHQVMRMRVSGASVRRLLAQRAKAGSKVALYISGLSRRRLRNGATYVVAANELIATGDRFPALRDGGRGKRRVGTDLEALTRYIESLRRPLG